MLCANGERGDGAEGGVFFDLASPCSYLAHGRVGRICEEHRAELALRPMLLGGVHKAVGLRAPIEVPAKGRYQLRDIHRWAEYYGLPMRFPEPFPFRMLKTMRAAMWCAAEGEPEAFAREAFALYWEGGRHAEGAGGGRRGRALKGGGA